MDLEDKALDLFYLGGGKHLNDINNMIERLPCSQKIKNSILESFAIGQKYQKI